MLCLGLIVWFRSVTLCIGDCFFVGLCFCYLLWFCVVVCLVHWVFVFGALGWRSFVCVIELCVWFVL